MSSAPAEGLGEDVPTPPEGMWCLGWRWALSLARVSPGICFQPQHPSSHITGKVFPPREGTGVMVVGPSCSRLLPDLPPFCWEGPRIEP